MHTAEENEYKSCSLGDDIIAGQTGGLLSPNNAAVAQGNKRAHTAGTRGLPTNLQLSCERLISPINQVE